MAEETAPGEVSPGRTTSEYLISWAVTILGIAQVILGAIAQALGDKGDWGLAAQIIGSILAGLAALGYTGFRTAVKRKAQEAAALVRAGESAPSGNG